MNLPAIPERRLRRATVLSVLFAFVCVACSGSGGAGATEGGGSPGGRGRPGGGGRPGGAGRPGSGSPGGEHRAARAAVPVEVVAVARRGISSYIETNGTLEADNEIEIVARTSGPIVALRAEEGDRVGTGRVLARLDDTEHRAQVEIARVALTETSLAYERAKKLQTEKLISPETWEQARAAYESAKAQVEAAEIQLGYTEIRAPFDGWIVERRVDFAQQVSAGQALFRLSDFDPLLCPIRVPERELPRLRRMQRAYLTVEPFPGERFAASVLRISPVIEAETGTVKVTLQVDSAERLRPGMFARVFLEVATRSDALVIPKAALSLESIGDTVYVVEGGRSVRREVQLGFSEGDFVEVRAGVDAGEAVVVVGQDGLSNDTPVHVLAPAGRTDRVPAPGRLGAGEHPATQ